ncbi:Potassium/sodium hyperpolarization-activated cyclic nucleotide-gated channel 1 [Orchesella cincta]|uniref:Potassium/sodium hyperpolarization-activated cyclic nucleotide-gated channel 1 n=1 Tax=Orchesella cincta TaxID=48709 RepID=A0A1D2MT10_ORCCI|nr:Potassium/sodium hyperpolarization-activated cyclic nucleotide-gated channel 1 [Orchesella cincta]
MYSTPLAPSREVLTALDEPDIEIEYPLLTETHPPGGIPMQCENELLLPYKWYKKLRCWFLVSDNWVVQSGIVRGYLGLYHERFLHLLSFPYVIHPFSNFYCVWVSVICFLLTISLIIEPYLISFQWYDFVKNKNKAYSLTMSVLLLMDMALTFIVGRADPNTMRVILDPIVVRRKYMSCKFWFDLVTRFPYDSIILASLSDADEMVKTKLATVRLVAFFVKLFRFQKVYSFLYRCATAFHFSAWGTQMLIHGFLVAFCVHWGACLHWLLPDVFNAGLAKPQEMSWVTKHNLWKTEYHIQYINSFLRSLGNLLTLDGGDFTPRLPEEMFCTALLIVVAQSIFAFFVSTFSSMIIEFQKEDDRYLEMLACVEEYLRFRRIPEWLRQRVLTYYDKKYKGHSYSEKQILDTMSTNIRLDVLAHSNTVLIDSCYLFADAPLNVRLSLVQCLTYDICVPGDVMMSSDTNTFNMYFIHEGRFRVFTKFGGCVKMLSTGDFFGETALLCPTTPRLMTTVVAITFAEVYKLSKKAYTKCMLQFPGVHEIIADAAMKKINKELLKFDREIERAEHILQWKEFLKQRRSQKVEEFYRDADANRVPSYYRALQFVYDPD